MKGNCEVVVGMLFVSGMLVGCESPEMQKRNQRRLENMQRVTDMLARDEAGRPAKLRRSFDYLESRHQLDLVQCAKSQEKLRILIEEDFEYWERQQPIMYQRIDDEMSGDWESFNRTWPNVLD
jgi:hypothetical protein